MCSEPHGQSPFISRSGEVRKDQGTAVRLVNIIVINRWLQVSILASGLDLLAKYCRFILY